MKKQKLTIIEFFDVIKRHYNSPLRILFSNLAQTIIYKQIINKVLNSNFALSGQTNMTLCVTFELKGSNNY